ncbi:MAG: lipoprotein LpqV, partial [Mycobacterium sp.]
AGTWNVPWARLSAARQAAVIVAARAAAADECG